MHVQFQAQTADNCFFFTMHCNCNVMCEETNHQVNSFWFLICPGYVVCSGSATWTSNIPTSVVALGGSCVVIPCTYDHPSNTITAWKPFWFIQSTKGEKTVTVYSNVSKIAERFQNRTSMPGNVQEKNCSLQINSVKQHDTPGPYFFRIVMPGFNNYSYYKNPTRITFKGRSWNLCFC